jgi:hypothetical protein
VRFEYAGESTSDRSMVVNDEGRDVRKVDGGEDLGLGSEGSIEGECGDVVVFRDVEVEGGEDESVDSAIALASSCSFCLILPIPRLS